MQLGLTRRQVLAGALALGAGCGRSRGRSDSAPPEVEPSAPAAPPVTDAGAGPLLRRIPSSGEEVPAIGLGSWQTFDVGDDELATVQPVVERFLALGGRVIDSSPMYGRAEQAIGAMLRAIRQADPAAPAPFLATKVWTEGARAGQTQMKRSRSRLGATTIDLMQVHNLLDWKVHLPILRAQKDAGTIRYLGVTHYDHDAFDELERIIRDERIDFVQLPYSVTDRLAERRLLPAAQDAGVAVLVMEPFDSGALFRRVAGRELPAWAADLDCTSWAQLFLKFLVGHPAVTCPVPATSKVKHVEDNLGALFGRLPDTAQRQQIVDAVG